MQKISFAATTQKGDLYQIIATSWFSTLSIYLTVLSFGIPFTIQLLAKNLAPELGLKS